jgi:hypothetical protein
LGAALVTAIRREARSVIFILLCGKGFGARENDGQSCLVAFRDLLAGVDVKHLPWLSASLYTCRYYPVYE